MTHLNMKLAMLLLAVLAAGCTTFGTGFGSTATGVEPVNFTWKSTGGVSGTINAKARDGTIYAGQFFQISSDTSIENLGPLWDGWGPDWRTEGWAYWNPGPQFMRYYTGKVLANLSAADGRHMRCKFQLANPADGLDGGGAGECQIPGGTTIEATFPRAS